MSNILPLRKLKDFEVRNILNKFGGRTDNVFGSKYKPNAKTNKWSKRKPVKYRSPIVTGNEDPPYWKANNGLCGFAEGSILFNTVDDLVTAYNNNATFYYELPSGGETEAFRSNDYLGYNPEAQAPFWEFYMNGAFISTKLESSVDFEVVANNDIDESTNLVMGDFMPQGQNAYDWYFGVVIEANGVFFKKSHAESLGTGVNVMNRIFSVTYGEVADKCGEFSKCAVYPCLYQFRDGEHGLVMALPVQRGDLSNGLQSDVVIETPFVGWYENTYYRQVGGKKTFTGTLAYSKTYEGSNVKIYAGVQHSDGSEETIAFDENLKLVATLSDDERNFMDVTLSGNSSTSGDAGGDDKFYMDVVLNIKVRSYSQPLSNELE